MEDDTSQHYFENNAEAERLQRIDEQRAAGRLVDAAWVKRAYEINALMRDHLSIRPIQPEPVDSQMDQVCEAIAIGAAAGIKYAMTDAGEIEVSTIKPDDLYEPPSYKTWCRLLGVKEEDIPNNQYRYGVWQKLYLRGERGWWPPADCEAVNRMVDRFLSWKLPKGLKPDLLPEREDGLGPYSTGTNLLSAEQAREMIVHMLYQSEKRIQTSDAPAQATAQDHRSSVPSGSNKIDPEGVGSPTQLKEKP